jgi:hypothetical protein
MCRTMRIAACSNPSATSSRLTPRHRCSTRQVYHAYIVRRCSVIDFSRSGPCARSGDWRTDGWAASAPPPTRACQANGLPENVVSPLAPGTGSKILRAAGSASRSPGGMICSRRGAARRAERTPRPHLSVRGAGTYGGR